MSGVEILGRYRIVAEIGRGAMGIVYKAEDSVLERIVAVKTVLVRADSEDLAGYLARFRQEAKALAGLNHPSIITVYDFGDTGEVAYMAMELVDGRELRHVLEGPRLPVAVAVEIAAQVAEGLAFAHARGIVHRDIKPGNIMVLAGHRAKIMDFGLARVRASDVKTQAGMVLGSPRYMSPEQVVGRGLDHRSDIFSVGAVLYEMLAGNAPFSGDDVPQIMFNVCNAHPPPPSRVNREVADVLDLIVARAMEKNPDARYASAADLAADLRAVLAGAQPAARATPPRAPRGEATAPPISLTAEALGLAVSHHFDSKRAIERLARPRKADRALLAAVGAPAPLAKRLRRDRWLAWRTAAIALGLAGAAAIVFL